MSDNRSDVESRRKYHVRVNKLIKFFNKTDKLESSIYDFIVDITSREFTPEHTPYNAENMKVMIRNLCAPEEVLYPEFLKKISFPYIMLRLALSIYDMNPIPANHLSYVRLSEDERNDRAIAELIWFQFLAGATPNQIESNLVAFRELRANSSASRSHCDYKPPQLQRKEQEPERKMVVQKWAAKQIDAKPIETAVATQRHQNVDAADSTCDQSSEDQGTVAEFAIDGEIVCAQAPDATALTKKVVKDEEVTRSSVLITPRNIDRKPAKSFHIPHPHHHRRLRDTRHQQRRNTRQYCFWCSIPNHTPTGPTRVIGELSPICAVLIATRKGLAQPRRDRPKQTRTSGYCCRLIDNTSQELTPRA